MLNQMFNFSLCWQFLNVNNRSPTSLLPIWYRSPTPHMCHQHKTSYCPVSVDSLPNIHVVKSALIIHSRFEIISKGYIDVGDGCWRRNMLATTLRCWWRFWPILSTTSSIFYSSISVGHQKMSPISKFCNQHLESVINTKSPTSNCHQHLCSHLIIIWLIFWYQIKIYYFLEFFFNCMQSIVNYHRHFNTV